MDNEVLLSIRELRVQYGQFLAVDGVSFDLAAGQLLGLVGPNGAGKTTTLRAAAGLQPISTGRVSVMGHDVFRDPVSAGRHLGFTPDTPTVYANLTVEQYLDFIGQCYGLDAATRVERIDHWLEQLWLRDKRIAKISALSRGMRQRLAVARTLISDPHVILLDEPAAGLDPAGRVEFRRLLASLRDQGRAIVVSSHILADLADYCTHIAIMERGRLLRFGSVAQVAGDSEHERCQYQVVLTHAVGDATQRLAGIDGLTRVQVHGDRLTLEYDQDRAAAAALLQRLLAGGFPVAEFHVLRPDLEQAYLRSGIEQVD